MAPGAESDMCIDRGSYCIAPAAAVECNRLGKRRPSFTALDRHAAQIHGDKEEEEDLYILPNPNRIFCRLLK